MSTSEILVQERGFSPEVINYQWVQVAYEPHQMCTHGILSDQENKWVPACESLGEPHAEMRAVKSNGQ